jgi:hypothetical protein
VRGARQEKAHSNLTRLAGKFIFGHGYYFIPLAADCAADLFEHFHDGGLVWPFEIQKQAAAARHPRELGYRVFRISPAGAGQSLGQLGLYSVAAQNHPGNHHTVGLRCLRNLLSARKNPVELRRGVYVYSGRGGIRIPAAKELIAGGLFKIRKAEIGKNSAPVFVIEFPAFAASWR